MILLSCLLVLPCAGAITDFQNNFEFKTTKFMAQPQGGRVASTKADQPDLPAVFSFGAPAAAQQRKPVASFAPAAADALRTQDQVRMQQPEPATPGSVTSESRGMDEPGPPPLTTLHNLNTPVAFGAASDSDTVTPLMPAHSAGHVPRSMAFAEDDSPAAVTASKSRKLVWSDVLLWKAPLQTASIFVLGLVTFWLLTFAAYGAHKFTLVSGGCLF